VLDGICGVAVFEGGSMSVLSAGGGSDGIASSADADVSTVMCLVLILDFRYVYNTGEQFTAIEGFL